ncbi:endonuclease/exonuclease/phosphatase family protein [Lacticaseibacillus suihuaensis]
MMRLTTYNIRYDTPVDGDWAWAARRPYVIENLRRLAPDLFCVEEALPHQYADLNALAGFAHVGIPRDGDGQGEAAAIYYDPAKFTLEDAGHQWLSATPTVPSFYPGTGNRRVFQWARLKEAASGREFVAVTAHLDDGSADARVAGVRQIGAFLTAQQPGLPVFVCGDFNMEPDDPAYAAMPASFEDSLKVAAQVVDPLGGTWMDDLSYVPHANPVMQRLDYVFVRDLAVASYAVDTTVSAPGKYASDHFPVTVELNFREENHD